MMRTSSRRRVSDAKLVARVVLDECQSDGLLVTQGTPRVEVARMRRILNIGGSAQVWYWAHFLPTISVIYRRKLLTTSGGHAGGDVYADILQAWTEDGRVVNPRQMPERYDRPLPRGFFQRLERQVAAAVDAAFPMAVPTLTLPGAARLADLDVKAEPGVL